MLDDIKDLLEMVDVIENGGYAERKKSLDQLEMHPGGLLHKMTWCLRFDLK